MINAITTIFNNREIASFIWILFFILIFLPQKSIRKPFGKVIVAFFQKRLVIMYLLMLFYVVGIIVPFYIKSIWDTSLIKDTIFWFLGSALVTFFSTNKINDGVFFRKYISDTLKFIIIFEFIVALHPFSLLWELALQFVIMFFVMINSYSQNKEEHIQVFKLSNVLLKIFSSAYLIISIYKTAVHIEQFATFNVLRTFLFAPAMSILFIPFVYFVALYMKYDFYFTQISIRLDKDKILYKYVKRRIFRYCGFNLNKLNRFIKNTQVYKFDSFEEVDSFL